MSDTAHQEKHFEAYIVSKLAAQGWKVGETLNYDQARERIYGMPYEQWKDLYQPEATPEQMAAFEKRQQAKAK